MKLLVSFFVIIVVLGGCSTIGGRNLTKEKTGVSDVRKMANRIDLSHDKPVFSPSSSKAHEKIRSSAPGMLETDQLDQL
jgi:hypothetical protein